MSKTNWEADKMLDVYLHDYFVKRNLRATARAFQAESRVPIDTVAIDSPDGFLMEWWSVFWDIFAARDSEKISDGTASQAGQHSVTPQQLGKRHQQIPKQRHAQQQQLSKGTDSAICNKNIPLNMQRTASANALTRKMYEEKLKLPQQVELLRSGDDRVNLLEPYQLHMLQSAAVSEPPSGVTIHGVAGTSSGHFHEVHQSSRMNLGLRGEMNPVGISRTIGFEEPLPVMTGFDQGVSGLPLKGWPLTQLLNVNNQQQKLYLPNSHLTQQPVCQNNMMLPEQLVNYGVTTADDSFPNSLVGSDQGAENVSWPKKAQSVPVASSAQILDTANVRGQLSISQSTLLAQFGRATSATPKGSSMSGVDALDSLKSPVMQSVDMDNHVENGSMEEYEAHGDVISNTGAGLSDRGKSCEGFSLKEVHLLSGAQNKIECCDFSSDGKYLVSGGYDKRATLWCTDSFVLMSELEEHSLWVTDVRFSPSMPRLATSSADKTIRIWNIDNPGSSLRTFTGHSCPVMSLDFHPIRDDFICSSDRDNEIRYWSVKSGCCSGVLKGGANHMRFQPRLGPCLAAASENVVSLHDVEIQICRQKLQGHKSTIRTLCWDLTGDHLVSLSDDLVQVWAIGSSIKGELVHQLNSNGKKFHSCVFHPTQPSVLIIGSYQTLELWDMKGQKTTTVRAHEQSISCLAASSTKGLVASAGYDKCIRIWE
ncbi:hypothetical protein SAY87_017354 [Trapa incisa]|uniref:Transcriptional corepressor LEUNIG-like n=1 Tax=Trapa incisa TaxID=236973 RepID=A0AAN7QZY1_9MYRT|nr:hypothetical protein SAY87_017354 [Trapa incisa]